MKKKWIENYLTEQEIEKISSVVQEVEQETDGEIVSVIVQRSSAIGHVKWLLASCLTLCFVTAEFFYHSNHWDPQSSWLPIVGLLLIYFLSVGLSRLKWFQRVLTSNEDEIAQVHQRAELEFARAHIRKTERRTGILIFASVMERRAVILADEGIARHCSPETWDEVVTLLTGEFKEGRIGQGFEKAIRKAGEILKAKLPPTARNPDELPNRLVISPPC
jgi:putative membrane protein